MKTSFITTVYNEEHTIHKFLGSLFSQTKYPDEIVIVDGGSTDRTIEKIRKYIKLQKKRIKVNLLVKKGNRSVGRNEAIKQASGDIILCSDAGNILDKNWIKNITRPFINSHLGMKTKLGKKVDVVAGYYEGKPKNIFQKCLIPFTLVMKDKVDPNSFLPSTRSVAFTKSIWKKAGRFNERLSHNEDYAFAKKLNKINAKILFAQDAIVYWLPRKTYKEAFIMMFRFAFGDIEAGIVRSNVLVLFARYFLVLYIFFLTYLYKSLIPVIILVLAFILYVIWSIKKNYTYVREKEAFIILPLLQFTADAAVLLGSFWGLIKAVKNFNYRRYAKQNTFLIATLVAYIIIELLTLQWGLPNKYHPFPYHMDEWHQFHAVGTTFTQGTPNVAGSANGTMFHFIVTGFYLAPFMLFNIIDPLGLTIDNSIMRERIFEILRINTLLFGVLAIASLYYVAKLLNVSKNLVIFLFTFSPIWLSLSGYFKYDIALTFWIILALFFLLRFIREPENRNYILAAIPVSLAVSVKVSAIPLFALYILSYFVFSPQRIANIRYFFLGSMLFIVNLFLFGMPDTLFGKGNIGLYLFENVVQAGNYDQLFQLGMDQYSYLFFHEYPLIFGHGLWIVSIFAFCILLYVQVKTLKDKKVNKGVIFIICSFLLFVLSLLPLGIYAGANRALVLLPFLVLCVAIVYQEISKVQHLKLLLLVGISVVLAIQLFESFGWYYIRLAQSPQETASLWIQKNIQRNETIGLENIPIYQSIPDILQKEFYFNQYRVAKNNRYNYVIVDSETKQLPSLIVITNGDFEMNVFKDSPKKRLLKRLEQEEYKKIAAFTPDFRFYQYFGNAYNFVLSGIIVPPSSIVVYKK